VQPAEGGVPLHVQVGQQQQVLEVPAGNKGAHRLVQRYEMVLFSAHADMFR
jgi:hypothetical protein